MSIDLDGLALIDMMLDSIVELRIMPNGWTEQECKYLETIHNTLLRLNQHWENMDSAEMGGTEILSLRNTLCLIVGYSEMVRIDLKDQEQEDVIAHFARIERLIRLFYGKVDYLNAHLSRTY